MKTRSMQSNRRDLHHKRPHRETNENNLLLYILYFTTMNNSNRFYDINLIIDKTTLEEARDRNKNLSCVWIDVKKTFDSVNHKWLTLCLQMHNIPLKIINFIKNTMESWSITLKVKPNNAKESIGPIYLKQGILIIKAESFCVRLFTLCLNPIPWWF